MRTSCNYIFIKEENMKKAFVILLTGIMMTAAVSCGGSNSNNAASSAPAFVILLTGIMMTAAVSCGGRDRQRSRDQGCGAGQAGILCA